jgi:hypothetical protein
MLRVYDRHVDICVGYVKTRIPNAGSGVKNDNFGLTSTSVYV